MLKPWFDAVMERRSTKIIAHIGDWLPDSSPVLDLGSGTGHLSARLERELGIEMVPADVSDIHVTGRKPVLIDEGPLPFTTNTYAGTLMIFMLHYPTDPVGLLMQAARVTRGPIILVQSVYSGRIGYWWLRLREFVWTYVAFHVSRSVGYVPPDATFAMRACRFYDEPLLARHLADAGLSVRERRNQPVLFRDKLVVAALMLVRSGERNEAVS
jgi:SAM-dependent methyltransferase